MSAPVLRLTLMTFNVGNGLAEPGLLATALRAARADVVGLQELASAQADMLAAKLRDVYPHQVLLPDGFAGKGLLSRYPMLEMRPVHLYPGRPDLRAAVDVEGTSLGVLVAHPPPPRVRGGRITFDGETMLQLDGLLDLALQHVPSVLLGDFNMTRRNPFYSRFSAAGLADAFAVAGSGRGWTLPMRIGHARVRHGLHGMRLRPVARVDYIWYTPGLHAEAAWVGADAGSDHLPVLARLALCA